MTPHWLPAQNVFNGGFARISDAFVALVNAYGSPAPGSLIIDATSGADVPSTDILGRPRPPNAADLGCFEVISSEFAFADGFED